MTMTALMPLEMVYTGFGILSEASLNHKSEGIARKHPSISTTTPCAEKTVPKLITFECSTVQPGCRQCLFALQT